MANQYATGSSGKTQYVNYNSTTEDLGVSHDPTISEAILDDAAFLTARLFGGPIMMRDEVDPLIRASTGTNNLPNMFDNNDQEETHQLVVDSLLSLTNPISAVIHTAGLIGDTIDASNAGRYSIGRTTAQTIAVNPTIVSIAPGKARYLKFLSGFGQQSVISDALKGISSAAGQLTTALKNSSDFLGLKNNHMFYTFATDYNSYINHVNMIARIMAIYLNIGDLVVPLGNGKKYKSYDWAHWYDNETSDYDPGELQKGVSSDNSELSWESAEAEAISSYGTQETQEVFSYYGNDPSDTIFGPNTYIHFYANSNSSYSEDVSTGTRQSAIQSQFEGVFSDTVKDIQFLFGGNMADSGFLGDVNALFSSLADMTGGVGDMAKAATNYLKGGRLIFPLMVDTTTYSKSLELGFRFSSPYGDPESVFLYCMLPLAHLMAFSFPKQIDQNMYTYPFLVSVYSKGYANIDMGVVTSIRIARGGQDDASWSANGIATDIEVSLSVTPLHSELMISSTRHPFLFLQNYGMQEYLGTICGVNMKGDTVSQQLKLIGAIFGNWFLDLIPNVLRGIQDWVRNSAPGSLVEGIAKFLTLP